MLARFELNLNNNINLKYLDCSDNQLQKLNLNNNIKKLEYFNYLNNNFKKNNNYILLNDTLLLLNDELITLKKYNKIINEFKDNDII